MNSPPPQTNNNNKQKPTTNLTHDHRGVFERSSYCCSSSCPMDMRPWIRDQDKSSCFTSHTKHNNSHVYETTRRVLAAIQIAWFWDREERLFNYSASNMVTGHDGSTYQSPNHMVMRPRQKLLLPDNRCSYKVTTGGSVAPQAAWVWDHDSTYYSPSHVVMGPRREH